MLSSFQTLKLECYFLPLTLPNKHLLSTNFIPGNIPSLGYRTNEQTTIPTLMEGKGRPIINKVSKLSNMLEEKIKQRKNTGSAVILNRVSRESFPEMVTPKEVMEWAMQMSDHPDRGQQVQRPERAHTWCMWEKARRPAWKESEVRSEG